MNLRKTILALMMFIAPWTASADFADNVLIDPGANALGLNRFPSPGMTITPGIPPNATLTPFRTSDQVWPGYLTTHKTLRYVLAVSCGPEADEPCRPALIGDFDKAELTVAFVQTSDVHFKTEEGLMIGDSLNTVMQKIPAEKPWYTGNGECVRLPSGWNACFYVEDLVYDPNGGIYRPKPQAKVFRFLKDSPS